MEKVKLTGYLAAEDLVEPLLLEVGKKHELFGRLVLVQGAPRSGFWAQNIWYEPKKISFDSVSDAAKKLKAIQRNWVLYSFDLHRRAKLIAEQLPHVSAKPLEFPAAAPTAPLGSWTLLSANELLCAPRCSSPFPNGVPEFVENKSGPPSRAYLKLWEALTILGVRPKKGEHCLDAGASPGGWTWVLNELGAKVTAVDRSPLAPGLMKKGLISYRKGDAFSVVPGKESFDWIFCDVICYPEKLFEWVSRWLEAAPETNFVCTLKFQGKSHYTAIPLFAAIKGSRLVHLSQNKHELTWMRLAK